MTYNIFEISLVVFMPNITNNHAISLYKFSVFTVMPSKIKLQTIQYRNSRIWEMKEDKKYKKPCQESGLCNISYARYLEKHFTQIYKALHGDAMLVSLQE